ncbi:SRPBCC domain-containing protein [Actinomycetospora sp. TBRC 11914]|uniref:SRPBCC domain-containing protein n=1 Tax=Actinomycetospora sp. TBRC 11914 TaxID=2729387 RepID=UPI00145D5BEA|nr:SRPBCC domain-containing protein [Actinomycetospora sp. TBRC 11914]NMO92798.1 ATPase [Actinomycetospora sp. TBRC 11914]
MGFPDRIERTMELAHPPSRVWAALTTAEGLAAWFGDRAEIDLRPGGAGTLTWTAEGHRQDLRIERVEEPRVFGFTWRIDGLPEDDPRRTYVEFVLEPTPTGTRLHLTESGFAQLGPDEHGAHAGNTRGWAHELGELAAHLDAVHAA